MRFDLRQRDIQTVVVDIEGTTTPISFVHDVLFPFARREIRSYLQECVDAIQLREPLQRLREEWREDVARGAAPPPWHDENREQHLASITSYAHWSMDRDRKSFGLKALQGHIWARGYQDGALRGEVFPDVPAAFVRWRAAGISVAIFSSGSVLAQQMLFRTTVLGDLTPSIDAFFDTSVGPKTSSESYRRIADALGRAAGRLLFISDTAGELEAARKAGCVGLICVRPGHCLPREGEWVAIRDFSEVQ